jgi:hypothetical protein
MGDAKGVPQHNVGVVDAGVRVRCYPGGNA